MKKIALALAALSLALMPSAPVLAMSGAVEVEVAPGNQPVSADALAQLKIKYACAQAWLSARPQYSTARKTMQNNWAFAEAAAAVDNGPVFIQQRDLILRTIASLRIPC